MNLAESIDKVHETVIQEEGLNVSDLPAEIQRKIKGWNLLYTRLTKNPEDEKLALSLKKQSITIADKIQDFIETDFDEEEEEEEKPKDEPKDEEEEEETPPAPIKPDEIKKPENGGSSKKEGEEKEDEEEEETPPAPTKPDAKKEPKKFGNLVMEKKILNAIESNKDNRISIKDLQSIIGKEADYPEQEVNNIVLRKVFLASAYYIK